MTAITIVAPIEFERSRKLGTTFLIVIRSSTVLLTYQILLGASGNIGG